LYVLSSRFEGLPLVLIEAAAMGLPAVSFDCQTGPREIIAHGQTGLLVPPLQVNALADALQTCLLDDAIRMRYSQQAATYVGKKFAVDTVVDQWEALFKQLKSRPL
jgi:glycosyltransferase involved in cell wall biosynthesis